MNTQTSNEAAVQSPGQSPAVRKPLIQTVTGRVTSDKMDKTVTVLVERRSKHPIYGKVVIKSNKYHAHDESNECKTGDLVEIQATRKLSKLKAWRVVRVVEKAKEV
jgi:small subunit ribosomal protein S17